MGWGARRPWRGAGDGVRAPCGGGLAGTAHAGCGEAAQNPADPGALPAQPAQTAGRQYGREVVDGFAVGGEVPVPQRGAPGADGGAGDRGADPGLEGLVAGEDGEQDEQQVQQGGGEMDALHRLRQAAEGVGFARSGNGKRHHW